jgi:hypothetical protein
MLLHYPVQDRLSGGARDVGSHGARPRGQPLYDPDQVEEKRERGAADRSTSGHETV